MMMKLHQTKLLHVTFAEKKERKEESGGAAINNGNNDTWDCLVNCDIMATSNRRRRDGKRGEANH